MIEKTEKRSVRPSRYGVLSLAENRHRRWAGNWPMVTSICPSHVRIPWPPSIPRVQPMRACFRSTPTSSAICLGSIVKSAPVSRMNWIFNGPKLFFNVTGISASGMRPNAVTFDNSGKSIDTDGTLRRHVLHVKGWLTNLMADLFEKRPRCLGFSNYLSMVGCNEMPTVAFLQLYVRSGFYTKPSYEKYTPLAVGSQRDVQVRTDEKLAKCDKAACATNKLRVRKEGQTRRKAGAQSHGSSSRTADGTAGLPTQGVEKWKRS